MDKLEPRKNMSSYKIAVILPSRGLLFAKTFKEILENCKPYRHEIFFAHKQPIPDCFNEPVAKALKKKFTHVWFVEEDMVIPPDTLTKLLEADQEMIACDYPLLETPSCTVHRDPNGKAYFTGTGCLLVKYEILKQMKQPIFRSDIQWQINAKEDRLYLTPTLINGKEVYGYHDVTFGIKRYIQGKPITISDIVCYQRKLVSKGENDTNEGQDTIIEINQLAPFIFSAVEKPKDNDLLKHIFMGNRALYVTKESAAKFIKDGKAKKVEQSFDYLTINFENSPKLIGEICNF